MDDNRRVVVRVLPETHAHLLRVAGKIQQRTGKRTTHDMVLTAALVSIEEDIDAHEPG
jgi:hypothetical protein